MPRTPRIVEDRRGQILDAALGVFALKGFDRATNRDIAHAAGITAGLIYHYFESKQDLLRAALARYSPVSTLRSVTEEMPGLSPENLLRVLVSRLLDVIEDERFVTLVRIFLPEAIHGTLRSPMLLSVLAEGTALLEGYLARKMAQGELRRADAGLIAQLLLGSVMDIIIRRRVIGDRSVMRFSREQIVEAVVDSALKGLLPR